MPLARLPRTIERLLIACFTLVLAVPPLATLNGEDHDAETEENRELTPAPALPYDRSTLAAWPEAFTNYFADHFAFRSRLVRWQALFRLRVLRSSPNPDVILGRDGWLFYAADGGVEDYTGARPFSRPELDRWRETLQHTQDWLAEQGIRYLFVIAPDKHEVYPEFMPGDLPRVSATSRVDQLLTELHTRSTVDVLDLRSLLVAAKGEGRLYHRTDTHWNDLGAFAAYRHIVARLGSDVGPAATIGEFEQHVVRGPGLDLARMLGLKSALAEEEVRLEPRLPRRAKVLEPRPASRALMNEYVLTEQPGGRPRAVIFRDSFGSAMIPFLSEHFSRAVYLWQNHVGRDAVSAERPDVVIQEWVGRHLHTATPDETVTAPQARRQQ